MTSSDRRDERTDGVAKKRETVVEKKRKIF